ncbi:uncharacterized protein LOC129918112 [Episyrphus balteatus]|uniref:uncharacterized protein LOC129918112 n=1 Tax=Episyrphus balteatus TaxID=286459 RepID=UPI002486C392|nr:uncharacterized protein LOC129918112 [Episyrphus balteatus]
MKNKKLEKMVKQHGNKSVSSGFERVEFVLCYGLLLAMVVECRSSAHIYSHSLLTALFSPNSEAERQSTPKPIRAVVVQNTNLGNFSSTFSPRTHIMPLFDDSPFFDDSSAIPILAD